MTTTDTGTRPFSRLHRSTLSAGVLVLLVTAWIVVVDNLALWRELTERLSGSSAGGTLADLGYIITLGSVIALMLALPLLLLAQRVLLKPVLIGVVLLSGVLAYFTGELGIVFDKEMLRNLAETVVDRNSQEGLELVSLAMFRNLALTTLPPIAFLLWVQVHKRGIVQDQCQRLGVAAALVGCVAVLAMVNFKSVAYVSRENHELETMITPWYSLKSLNKLATSKRTHAAREFEVLGADAVQLPRDSGRRIGIMVVGETARADHFSLDGYERETNPELAVRDIVNFPDVRSCGTSTAFSVPCMFSFLNENDYSPEEAAAQSNALDVLASAGVDVFWVDSNSSCKGVCKRIPNVNLMRSPPDTTSPLYVDGAYQDEFLLGELDARLDELTSATDGDVLLVLHTMGSHGPAYYRRYPERLGAFQPACRSKAPQECSNEQIVNAYDNTILYTDRFVAAIIDRLDERGDDAFMLYASDHGESLGENGVYLHGLPRAFAPKAQRHVPMLAWFSDAFTSAAGHEPLPRGVRQDRRPLSHDNLSATLLGLFDVRTTLYVPELDLFAPDGGALREARL